jgi:two-component system osmolarity sensor histidine kinase EnvZ
MRMRLKTFLPRSLYGRAALILILPIVTIQLVVSINFIQRHYEGVTQQMTGGILIDVRHILDEVDQAETLIDAKYRLRKVATALEFDAYLPPADLDIARTDRRDWWDLSGRAIASTLHSDLPELQAVDLLVHPREVWMRMNTRWGPMELALDRRRVAASNPHQLLVLMLFTSLLMTFIAVFFLRAQLRPITKLAQAAEAFGKGHNIAYRPRGASEVRAAGAAFLDMRARIERQIEQRTQMLSGVSHDLRTPLTRMRLGLAMLPEDDEVEALQGDVIQMERLVDEFLSFARGDATEQSVEADPEALVRLAVENAQRAGLSVTLGKVDSAGQMRMRPEAITRALENLIGNATRYADRAVVSLVVGERAIRISVEDDGPGIPKSQRESALAPFFRLDKSRNQNRGGGVGLGLSIAADVARSHGGNLRLGQSPRLGGLRADLILAR